MAGIDMEHDLPLHAASADHPLLEALGQRVGALYRPELRHDEVSVHVGKAAGANSAQMMDADDARHAIGVERFNKFAEQFGIFFVQQAAGGMSHQPQTGPP